MRKVFALIFSMLLAPVWALEVASLHPLVGDIVQQVGGDRVKVIHVGKPGMKVHEFTPTTKDLKAMSRARIIFASGKGLEIYLGDLSDSLQAGQRIVEVGRTLPSQKISAEDQIYACCPNHAVGGIDPHWWHNVRLMSRATKVIQKELSKSDPEGKAIYKANAKALRAELKQLDRWVKAQVATIPKGQRHLVTSHAAFGYFCKAYGFKATYVLGLSAQGEVSSAQLADSIREIKAEGIRTVFPEMLANPKMLRQIGRESGAKLGTPLVADGAVPSYMEFIRGNVRAIVEGLR